MRITLERLTKPPAGLLIDLERHQPYGPIERRAAPKSHLCEWRRGLHSRIGDKQPESAFADRAVDGFAGQASASRAQLTICKETFAAEWILFFGDNLEHLRVLRFPVNGPQ
jgi:hypothetical protein